MVVQSSEKVMKADASDKSLTLVFIHRVKLHPTIHRLTLLTLTLPIHARLNPLWLELPVAKIGYRGQIKRRKQWITDNPSHENLLREVSVLGHII